MKKNIHNPDGTIEEIEGTPEEIAAYEKMRRERTDEAPKQKPKVIKGKEASRFADIKKITQADVERMMEEIKKQGEETRKEMAPYRIPFYQPYWMRSGCAYCLYGNCQMCNPPGVTIICGTTTGNSLSASTVVCNTDAELNYNGYNTTGAIWKAN